MRIDGLPLTLLQLLISAFFALTFLQSGLDKVFHRKGNAEYFAQVFGKGPLKPLSGLLLFGLTALELLTGAVNAAGGLAALTGEGGLGTVGVALAALTMLSLCFGQRLAKDYAGAAGAVPYFLTALLGLYFYGLG